MAYSTATDMQTRFPLNELLDLTNQNDQSAETINEDALSVALDDASAAIDAVLSSRMKTPLSPAPFWFRCAAILRVTAFIPVAQARKSKSVTTTP